MTTETQTPTTTERKSWIDIYLEQKAAEEAEWAAEYERENGRPPSEALREAFWL